MRDNSDEEKDEMSYDLDTVSKVKPGMFVSGW